MCQLIVRTFVAKNIIEMRLADTHYFLHLCTFLCFTGVSTVCLEMQCSLCNQSKCITWEQC